MQEKHKTPILTHPTTVDQVLKVLPKKDRDLLQDLDRPMTKKQKEEYIREQHSKLRKAGKLPTQTKCSDSGGLVAIQKGTPQKMPGPSALSRHYSSSTCGSSGNNRLELPKRSSASSNSNNNDKRDVRTSDKRSIKSPNNLRSAVPALSSDKSSPYKSCPSGSNATKR